MDEFVLSGTTVQHRISKMNSVAERKTTIDNVNKSGYMEALESLD